MAPDVRDGWRRKRPNHHRRRFPSRLRNRGNARRPVFCKDGDYDAFVTLLAQAQEHQPIRLIGYGLMPNHFYLAVWPHEDGDLSRWMQWLMNPGAPGLMLRYAERNALRAGLVKQAEEWPRSSLPAVTRGRLPTMLHPGPPGPVPRSRDWLKRVNQAETQAELGALRRCVTKGTPLGTPRWVCRMAVRLELTRTLRNRGRLRKARKDPR